MMNIARAHVILIAATLVGFAGRARGQVPDSGQLIRVEVHNGKTDVVGHLVSIDAETLVLVSPTRRARVTFEIPRQDVAQVWISTGEHRATEKGLLVGGLFGAVSGGMVGALSGTDQCGSWICYTPAQGARTLGVIGGLAGSVLGAISGYSSKRPIWSPIELPATMAIRSDRGGRAAVMLELRL